MNKQREDKLRLRRAENTPEDAKLLYDWRMDPAARQNSFHHEEFSFDEHLEWYHRMMDDENRVLYIMMLKDEGDDQTGIPVGQIRFDFSKDKTEAEISYSIAPEYRGRGFGRAILALGEETIREQYPSVQALTGEVLSSNKPSAALFMKLGYEQVYAEKEYVVFRKRPWDQFRQIWTIPANKWR